MLRMVRCEEEREYEILWKELNKAIINEPFLPQKYTPSVAHEWSMTPELKLVVNNKRVEGMMQEEELSEQVDDVVKRRQSKGVNGGVTQNGNAIQNGSAVHSNGLIPVEEMEGGQ